MPPEPTSVEDMVEALRQADKPVLDAKALGERVGLSAYTIRDRRDELEKHENIASMQVGQTRVWWFDDPNTPEGPDYTRRDWALAHAEEAAELEAEEADAPDPVPEPTTRDATTLVEGLASPRTVNLGAGLMLLSVVAMYGSLTVSGALTLYLAGVGVALALGGTAAIVVATLAQFALGLPLRGLRPRFTVVRE